MYILFEGIDTCGKSTQIEMLKGCRPDIVVTREPGGTRTGEKIRDIVITTDSISPKAETLLFLADRAEHFKRVVEPNLDAIVVSDRGFVSGMAYAMESGEEDFDLLLEMNLFALGGRLPDLVIFFHTDEETLEERISLKEADVIESRGVEYLMRVQKRMREILGRVGIETVEIYAGDDREEIHQRILKYLKI